MIRQMLKCYNKARARLVQSKIIKYKWPSMLNVSAAIKAFNENYNWYTYNITYSIHSVAEHRYNNPHRD